MWSQGIHARSGVSCADCHMPYMREGAIKVSNHQVRSPLLDVSRSCQTCHRFPEEELKARVTAIQSSRPLDAAELSRQHGHPIKTYQDLDALVDAPKGSRSVGPTAHPRDDSRAHS